MITVVRLFATLIILLASFQWKAFADDKPKKNIRILLVTGGCCHNYDLQTEALKTAFAKYGKASWTVVNEGGTGTSATISLYDKKKWAKGYDLVIHNECFADTKDQEYIKRITSAHFAGAPAVVIHCAVHSYRSAEISDWRQFLGVTSMRHDHQSRYPVKAADLNHFILKDFPVSGWTGPLDELYVIQKIWPGTHVLATSVSEKDGKTHPVAWINKYGKAKVFGTTLGHSDDMWKDPVFLNMLVRGIAWAAGKEKFPGTDRQAKSYKIAENLK